MSKSSSDAILVSEEGKSLLDNELFYLRKELRELLENGTERTLFTRLTDTPVNFIENAIKKLNLDSKNILNIKIPKKNKIEEIILEIQRLNNSYAMFSKIIDEIAYIQLEIQNVLTD